MYESTNFKQKKVYNLKKEAKVGAVFGLVSTVVALGYSLLTNEEMRAHPLEVIAAATICAPIAAGILAIGFYGKGYIANLFSYKNND